ncbi:hypothetical protein GCM10009795_040090 [Nocardioides hankookensis]|uniref:Terminase n=1 Tax=Nocardioides hankookensis TaxID=443157 RepID=A0ABW1LPD4_9ACTN
MTRSGGRRPKLAKRRATWSHEVDYVYTFGPEVADIAAAAGLEPDEDQQWILDQGFGYLRDGRPAAFEVDIIAARQNIKTASIIMFELGWLYVTEEPLIIHSAHELDATEEAFIDIRERIEGTPQLAKWLDPSKGEKDHPGVFTGNGSWEIHLLGGTRLKYKARTNNAGRALTADKLVLDEGFALKPSHIGSLYPTLTTIFDCQVVMASSAGKLESAVLRDHRERGRAGTSPRQFYAEWGDVDAWSGCKAKGCDHAKTAIGCALDDETRWARIMPAWGRRVFPETIRAMRQAMPPEEFAREFMVWWDDPPDGDGTGVIDLGKWGGLVNPKAKAPKSAVLVLDVAPSRKSASIGVAGPGKKGRTLLMVQKRDGYRWVVPQVKRLLERQSIAEVALNPGSQASVLIPDLVEEGIEFAKINTTDVAHGCAWLLGQMEQKKPGVEHVGQPELDTEVADAITRMTGENELFDRRDKSITQTAIVAASTAGYRWSLQEDYDVMDSVL